MIRLDINKVMAHFGINISDDYSAYGGLSVETFNGNGMMYNVLVVNNACDDDSEVLGIVSQDVINNLKK